MAAAVAGDALNFSVGRWAGARLVARWSGRWLKPAHRDAARAYFDRFGAWTIVLARFVPVVRTFAPFLAGAGDMPYAKFAAFNLLGGAVWVGSLACAGVFFGTLPFVREHISLITLGIVVVSVAPVAIAAARRLLGRSLAGAAS